MKMPITGSRSKIAVMSAEQHGGGHVQQPHGDIGADPGQGRGQHVAADVGEDRGARLHRRLTDARPVRLRRKRDQPFVGTASVEQQIDRQHQRDAERQHAVDQRLAQREEVGAELLATLDTARQQLQQLGGGIRSTAAFRTSSTRLPRSAACSLSAAPARYTNTAPATTIARTRTRGGEAAPQTVCVEPRDHRVEADRQERGDHQQQHPFPNLQPQPDGRPARRGCGRSSCRRCRSGGVRS